MTEFVSIAWKTAILFAVCALWLIMRPSYAEAAITTRFPDADSVSLAGGNFDAYAGVSEGGNYDYPAGTTWFIGRDTPQVDFKVFYQLNGPGASGAASFNVRLLHACDFSEGVYTRGNGDMIVSIMRVDTTTGEPTGGATQQKANNVPANCNGVDMDFVIPASDVQLVPSRYGSEWGAVVIRANKINGVGANSFQIQSMDGFGLVSFSEQRPQDVAVSNNPGPQTSFAIWDNPNSFNERSYTFEFEPDCDYFSNYSDIYLRWFDADMDQLDPNVSFTIELVNDNGTVASSIPIDRNTTPDIGDTGPPSYRFLQLPNASPTQFYRWTWQNVRGINGLQIWMPFSEMNRFITCPATPAQLSCTVQVVATPNPGANFLATFTITNNSGSSIGPADGYRIGASNASTGSGTDNYLAPDVANWVRRDIDNNYSNGSIASGSSRVWTGNFRASQLSLFGGEHDGDPANPTPQYSATNLAGGSHQFDWRIIQNDVTWVGNACEEDVVVNNLPLLVVCNLVASPGNPSAGQRFSIRASVTNQIGSGGTVTNASNPLTVSVSGGVLAPTQFIYSNDPLDPTNETGTVDIDVTAPNSMGSLTINGSVQTPSGAVPCSTVVQIAKKPYTKFFGADVNAGGSFNNGITPCGYAGGAAEADPLSPNTTTIKGFARNDRSLPLHTYHGSSVEFAAFSMGRIVGDTDSTPNDEERGFFSGSLRNRGQEGLYLTFANMVSPNRWSGSEWGGNFSQAPRCIEDYYTTTRLPTVTNRGGNNVDLHNNGGTGIRASGQYQIGSAGGTTILHNDPNVPFSTRVTLYVEGDLFIDDNINYSVDYSAAVPYLSLIVKGDIYIDADVTNIDGLLIAQPVTLDGTSGGRVYTCATRTGVNINKVTAANLNATCGNKLTVHGSVIAQQIRFLRSNGSINNSTAPEFADSPTVAEIIELTPEFYVGIPMFKPVSGSNNGAQTYHAIQALPPVF